MKIESHLQPNCSESSWRVTGPKKELEALKKKFLDRCDCDEHTEWIKETLLLQTRRLYWKSMTVPGIISNFTKT